MLNNEMRNLVAFLREQGKHTDADRLEAALDRIDNAFARKN